MPQRRVAIVLYSYEKQRYQQARLWEHSLARISRCGCATVFLTVNPNEEPLDILGFKRLPIDSPPGYEFLPDKTIAMLRWLICEPNWDYLIKCDDDVLLDPAAVQALVEQDSLPDYQSVATYVYGSDATDLAYHRGKCSNHVFNQCDVVLSPECRGLPFAVGQCYVLSRMAVTAAVNELDSGSFSLQAAREAFDVRGIGAEDVLLAYLLRKRGIAPVESLRLIQSRSRLRGLVKLLVLEAIRSTGNPRDNRLCIGALTHNREPWLGEYRLINAWFSAARSIASLFRVPKLPCREPALTPGIAEARADVDVR